MHLSFSFFIYEMKIDMFISILIIHNLPDIVLNFQFAAMNEPRHL